jgi:hypothetical protein
MAWTSGAGQSGVYLNSLMAMMTAVAFTPSVTTCSPLTAANWKIALHSSALTPGTAPINWSATSVKWANTSETSGTGWAAGGVLLSTAAAGGTSTAPTLAEGTAGSLRYDMGDISVASTTLATGPRGCIIYCDTSTGPTGPPDYSDLMLVAVCFGGDYPTNNGTFGITWSATGIFEIDTTP